MNRKCSVCGGRNTRPVPFNTTPPDKDVLICNDCKQINKRGRAYALYKNGWQAMN